MLQVRVLLLNGLLLVSLGGLPRRARCLWGSDTLNDKLGDTVSSNPGASAQMP
jgi:hypothetical protein